MANFFSTTAGSTLVQNLPAILACVSGFVSIASLYLHKQKPTVSQVETIAENVVNKVVIPTSLVSKVTAVSGSPVPTETITQAIGQATNNTLTSEAINANITNSGTNS